MASVDQKENLKELKDIELIYWCKRCHSYLCCPTASPSACAQRSSAASQRARPLPLPGGELLLVVPAVPQTLPHSGQWGERVLTSVHYAFRNVRGQTGAWDLYITFTAFSRRFHLATYTNGDLMHTFKHRRRSQRSGVSHARQQPARQEQLGLGVLLRDTPTHSKEEQGIELATFRLPAKPLS